MRTLSAPARMRHERRIKRKELSCRNRHDEEVRFLVPDNEGRLAELCTARCAPRFSGRPLIFPRAGAHREDESSMM